MSGDQIGGLPRRLMADDTTVPMTPLATGAAIGARALIDARALIGTREEGGNNRGALVELMLKEEGGKPGDPWCLAFVQHCYGRAYAYYNARKLTPRGLHVGRFAQNCLAKLPLATTSAPVIGAIALHYPTGFTGPGHCGIVEAFSTTHVATVEGNTNDHGDRDSFVGDGVHAKTRALSYWHLFIDLGRLDR